MVRTQGPALAWWMLPPELHMQTFEVGDGCSNQLMHPKHLEKMKKIKHPQDNSKFKTTKTTVFIFHLWPVNQPLGLTSSGLPVLLCSVTI